MKIWLITDKKNAKAYGARRILEEAKKNNITIKKVLIEDIELVIDSHMNEDFYVKNKKVKLPDLVIPRVCVSYNMKSIMEYLENKNVAVINTNISRFLAKDKFLSLQKLATASIPVPKTVLLKWKPNTDFIAETLWFPVIIKKIEGAQWKGIIKANTKEDFEDIIEMLEDNISIDSKNFILQEFIWEKAWQDIRLFVIGWRVVASMLRKWKQWDFKSNFSWGGSVQVHSPNETEEMLAIQAANIIGLDIAWIDLLFDKNNGYKICEVNASPGFEGLEQATNKNVAEEIIHFIKIRYLDNMQ